MLDSDAEKRSDKRPVGQSSTSGKGPSIGQWNSGKGSSNSRALVTQTAETVNPNWECQFGDLINLLNFVGMAFVIGKQASSSSASGSSQGAPDIPEVHAHLCS